MNEIVNNLTMYLENLIVSMGFLSIVIAFVCLVITSILPLIPLWVFITLSFITFGSFYGFVLSYICTIIGCMLAFFLTRKVLSKWIRKNIDKSKVLKKCLKFIDKRSISSITVIMSIPFTPAFAMNIAMGLSDIKPKKFLMSLLISKVFLVYFWGFVGVTFIECFNNPLSLIKVFLMLILAYVLSIVSNKIFKLDK